MSHRTAAAGFRVLIAAPFGRDAESVAGLLKQEGYDTLICPDLLALAGSLDESTGALLLTQESLAHDLGALQAALARQPPWSDIPVVFLVSGRTGSHSPLEVVRARLPDSVTNVITLERPLSAPSLVSAVASALRARQKQFEIRDRVFELDATARELGDSRDALASERHALEILNRTGAQVAAELDLARLVQTVVDAGRELTGAEFGAFFYNVPDEGSGSYMLYALSGAKPDDFTFGMPRATALFGPTFRGEGVIRSGDILADPRYGTADPHRGMPAGHLPVRSYLAVPVISRSGQVIGGLLFGHGATDMFDEKSEALMGGLAGQAATGIDNARLVQALQRANETLEDSVAQRTAELQSEMEARSQAEAALRQSQKMEAVGQLTGGIAHDFNNMMTGVIGGLDILKRRIAAGRTEDLDRFMEAAASSASRAASLTQRLLAFSRRQSLDPRPTDVNALVASLEDLLGRTMTENITVRVVLRPDLPLAIVDPNQLESALLNLAINARDAMPNGGTLTVATDEVRLDAAHPVVGSDAPSGRYVSVSVSDTGTGIAPDLIDKVFAPFFTTKPIGQGTGLGLSMVYGFAKQSNGQVQLRSRVGQGTSVGLALPAAPPQTIERPDVVRQAAPGGGQRVLVVEDDDTVRLLIRDVLQELGYSATETADARAALPILASDEPIDLMISDVGLPGMNGRELAGLARAQRPDLPILFVTGYAEGAAVRADFLGPGMSMITKPFALDRLAAAIEAVLAGQPVDPA